MEEVLTLRTLRQFKVELSLLTIRRHLFLVLLRHVLLLLNKGRCDGLIQDQEAERVYSAAVAGHVQPEDGVILDDPLANHLASLLVEHVVA